MALCGEPEVQRCQRKSLSSLELEEMEIQAKRLAVKSMIFRNRVYMERNHAKTFVTCLQRSSSPEPLKSQPKPSQHLRPASAESKRAALRASLSPEPRVLCLDEEGSAPPAPPAPPAMERVRRPLASLPVGSEALPDAQAPMAPLRFLLVPPADAPLLAPSDVERSLRVRRLQETVEKLCQTADENQKPNILAPVKEAEKDKLTQVEPRLVLQERSEAEDRGRKAKSQAPALATAARANRLRRPSSADAKPRVVAPPSTFGRARARPSSADRQVLSCAPAGPVARLTMPESSRRCENVKEVCSASRLTTPRRRCSLGGA